MIPVDSQRFFIQRPGAFDRPISSQNVSEMAKGMRQPERVRARTVDFDRFFVMLERSISIVKVPLDLS